MRRMSKLFAPLATFGTAVAVFLSANPAFAQAADAVRADRDKWLGLGAALLGFALLEALQHLRLAISRVRPPPRAPAQPAPALGGPA